MCAPVRGGRSRGALARVEARELAGLTCGKSSASPSVYSPSAIRAASVCTFTLEPLISISPYLIAGSRTIDCSRGAHVALGAPASAVDVVRCAGRREPVLYQTCL